MPERARIFVAEDSADYRELLEMALSRSDHQIVSTVETLDQALKEIPRFSALRINVALLDGNLGRESNNTDGNQIAAAIKNQHPLVKIIGIPTSGLIKGVDVNLRKGNIGKLVEVITSL